MESDKCCKECANERIESEGSRNEEGEEYGKCSKKNREDSGGIESDKDVVPGKCRLDFACNFMVKASGSGNVGRHGEVIWLPCLLGDIWFIWPVEAFRGERLCIKKSVPQIINAGGFSGIYDFFGEIVVGKIFFVLNMKSICCLLGGYIGLIEILQSIVVPSLVLSGEYREECCQKHAFQEKDSKEQGNEKCRVAGDVFHEEFLRGL